MEIAFILLILYLEELVDFRNNYWHFKSQLFAASVGRFTICVDSITHMQSLAEQITRYKVLYRYNDYCIDQSCANELWDFTIALDANSIEEDFNDHPHAENFELLEKSIESIEEVENFVAENESETVY